MAIDEFIAIISGLSLGLTEEERVGLKSGKLKFKTKYENKKLLRESGLETHSDIPDFPWNG